MAQAEKTGAFGDDQWGSRNGRSANTVVLLKHFTYEMMQLTKKMEQPSTMMPRHASTELPLLSLIYAAANLACQHPPATRTLNCY
jgi:hypothetical protein